MLSLVTLIELGKPELCTHVNAIAQTVNDIVIGAQHAEMWLYMFTLIYSKVFWNHSLYPKVFVSRMCVQTISSTL